MSDLVVADKPIVELVSDLEKAGAMDAVGLTLTDPDMPYQRWEDLGRFLGRIGHATCWWIGDWLNFGEALYGEESAQAVEATTAERYDEAQRITGYSHQTLKNYRSVAGLVAKSRRRHELGITLHGVVAPLEPDEQIEWLGRAVDEGWSRSDLSAALYEAKNGAPAEPGAGTSGSTGEGLTLAERLEAAARLVFHQGQPQRSGDVLVPGEAWQHLAVALGEE